MCHSTSVQQFNDCCATGQNGVCICSMHASHCLEDIEQICSWSELIENFAFEYIVGMLSRSQLLFAIAYVARYTACRTSLTLECTATT